MEKLSLNLNKQSVVILTTEEAQNVKGGGIKRSNRLGGACRYSRKHADVRLCCDAEGNSTKCVVGCI